MHISIDWRNFYFDRYIIITKQLYFVKMYNNIFIFSLNESIKDKTQKLGLKRKTCLLEEFFNTQ